MRNDELNDPLCGLNPADLLKQGVADDTLVDGRPVGFLLPPIEELAEIFPQFEILELIGKGGMGAVYRVRQRELDRIVALKILPPAIGEQPGFADRFAREAKALAKLNHPGIVTLYEFGQATGLYFILMEYVDGVNLRQLLENSRISPHEALAIVPQICDALQFAHDRGVVHRDIKPENILLDRFGRVKVADFGLAKLTGLQSDETIGHHFVSDLSLTEAGKIIGTPAYMAPEQIDRPGEVDHRADIYGLGVVFYQILTGELPGKNPSAPSKKIRVDVRLDEIVLRALEKKPEMRFQQASMMKTRVEELTDQPVPKKTSYKKLAVYATLMLVIALGWIGFDQYLKKRDSVVVLEKSNEVESSAETFVGLKLAEIQAKSELLVSDPKRAEVQRELKQFEESHPDFPNDESREIVSKRQNELFSLLSDFSKKYGPENTQIIELNRKLDWLGQIPLMGEKEINERVAEKIEAKDLSETNRFQIRLVTPGDASAEILKYQFGDNRVDEISVSRDVIVCDQHIVKASAGGNQDERSGFVVNLTFNEVGLRRLSEATKTGQGTLRVAIFIDGKVHQAPVVHTRLGANIQISGFESSEDCLDFMRGLPSWGRLEKAFEAWPYLLKIDEGEYAETYHDLSSMAKKLVTEKQWVDSLIGAREPMGGKWLVSRFPKSVQELKSLPGVPDGEYLVAEFQTDFKNKKETIETMILVKDPDSVWRIVGYFIR
jgi:serine/threonine protein kinase